jgi:aspartate aminotransferase
MKGSDRLNVLSESETLAITKRVRALKAEGKDVVGLTLGEPDFDTPDHIRDAAVEAIREGFTHYTPVAGIPELREAIAAKYRNLYGCKVTSANALVSTGAKQSLVNVILSLINPGDEVILSAPYWVSYREMFKMAEADVKVVETNIQGNFKATAAQFEAVITPKTKMLLLNSPSNPTGSMYNKDEYAAIVAVLERHPHVFLLSDEIYEHIVYSAEMISAAQFPSIADRTIVVNGVSKGFAMTGWRIGYILAPTWIVNLCDKYQGQITSGTSSISQRAALAALTGPLDAAHAMRDTFLKRRNWMGEQLHAIEGLSSYDPDAAFYFYPDFSAFFGRKTPDGRLLSNIVELCDYLMDDGLVAIVPGTAFGTDSHARISYAYSMDVLEIAVERLRSALNALK